MIQYINSMGAAADKSKKFAIRIVRLSQYLKREKKEYVLSDQILRSGTSIGANLSEASCAITKKDFLQKIYISLKECAETKYWIELLYSTGYLTQPQFQSLMSECVELQKIPQSTTKTTKNNLDKTNKRTPE